VSTDCLFCRIVAGEVPSTKVYEDADILAFLDIGPVVKGHTLVIPKAHHDPITGTPRDVLHLLIDAVQRIAAAQLGGLKADGVNVSQANGRAAGQVIPHVHFHVIPRFAADGHHWNWSAKKYDGAQEMQEFAARIAGALAP